ncbi:c6 zinc finger domain containing protein [Grosmannia clavigera kw1407]|uniref:C6 zinc finger domain containing protein n=1 Tax=Grosmannia clavigera (strain kw1407 / UAMH 11150) TaxID=655863 RepID=F0XSK2_GROCL|nr:c6 zinc finger domain containing protein [Grosmannia clavigera kw1407]EFW99158.1 c6 zinc finger domain containing protein [Grosmannia clavigera kw1407]
MTYLADYTSVFRVRLGNKDGTGIGGSGSSSQRGDQQADLSGVSSLTGGQGSSLLTARRAQERTRARPVVSCHACRTRKQKCDRLLPCRTCRRRGDEALCRYDSDRVEGVTDWPASQSSGGGRSDSIGEVAAVRQETQVQLQKLEMLVNGMVARSEAEDGKGGGKRGGSRRRRTSNAARGVATEGSYDQEQREPREREEQQRQRQKEAQKDFDQHDQQNLFPVTDMTGEMPGATNWATVLDSIRDIQSYLGNTGSDEKTDEARMGQSPRVQPQVAMLEEAESDIIFATTTGGRSGSGQGGRFTAASAAGELPGRQECDRLLTEYFQARFMRQPFVHAGHFQRTYSRFWATASASGICGGSPFLWLSMLASTLSIAATITGTRQDNWLPERERRGGLGDEEEEGSNADLALAARLRRLSTRCLLAGDYLTAQPLVVEALLLNALTRLVQRRDADPALWGTFCVATRLAQRMGYQQVDGGRVGGCGRSLLTPFEKEMRRRTWYVVEAYDMLYSFQFGMPAIVHEADTATDLPHNLRDDDFDEFCAELPPDRPVSDASVALYHALKLRYIRLLRRVVRLTGRGGGDAESAESADSLDRLAAELHAVYGSLPAHLQMPCRIRDCPFSDTSHDVMNRLVLDLLYHKAICMLFRQALTRDSRTASQSTRQHRRCCLVSALRILDLHIDFEMETRPASTAPCGTGRLATDRHMFGSVALHDFLLAATILCLDLMEGQEDQEDGSEVLASTHSDNSLEQRADDRDAKLSALRGAFALWNDRRLTSRDAAHAARVLGAIVRKLEEADRPKGASATTSPTTLSHMPTHMTYDWADPGPFDAVLNGPYNLDWYAIDSFLLDRQPEADVGSMLWSADLMALEND